jgi:glycosyltransferase involved in cell wall biosynthesis
VTSLAFHVDQLTDPALGGTGAYVRGLLPALARQDPSLRIRLFHARLAARGPVDPLLRDFWSEELPHTARALYPRWNLAGRPALPRSLASLDVLQAPSPAAVPPAGDRQKLVVTVHDLAFLVVPFAFPPRWRTMLRLGLRAAVKRADAIVTPSRNTAEDLLSRTNVNPSRVHVIAPGGTLPAAVPPAVPDEVTSRLKLPVPYILWAGTLEPRKNLVRLIRAYRRVASTGTPHALVLAGPLGWRHQTLLREIALPGPGEVVLTGPVSNAELDALYRRAAAFVYPALYEGLGLGVLEAMARAVPVICSNTSSLPEVVGDAAIQVNPMSVREMASAIETLVRDPGLAERLSQQGPARAERFSWDQTAHLTLQVYGKALEG